MPDKPKHNWLAIRTAYVVKGYTAQQCATEFKVDVTTVRKRASKEGWTAERHANTMHGEDVAKDDARKIVAAAAQSHREVLSKLTALVDDSITELATIEDIGERILARQRTITMATRIVVTGRIVDGNLPGQPSNTGSGIDDPGMPAAAIGDDEDSVAPAPAKKFIMAAHKPLAIVPQSEQAAG